MATCSISEDHNCKELQQHPRSLQYSKSGERRNKLLSFISCSTTATQNTSVLQQLLRPQQQLMLISVLICCSISSCSAWTCSSRSENALLGFKNASIDPDGVFDEWVPGTNCCYWPYVTCRESDGAVIALSITGSPRPQRQPYWDPNDYNYYYYYNNVSSQQQVPPGSTLADLTDLQMLKLQWIFFNSEIPSSWGSGFSESLVILIVNDCNLVGSIPSSLGYISKLQRLDLQSNSLTGIIPQKLCYLKDLNYLDVSYNALDSGAIVPGCFQNVPGLYLSTGNQDSSPNSNHAAAAHLPPVLLHPQLLFSSAFIFSFLGTVLVSVMNIML